MIVKSSAVAVLISGLLSVGQTALASNTFAPNENKTDSIESFPKDKNNSVATYLFSLNSPGTIEFQNQANKAQKIAQAKALQTQVIESLLALDPQAKVTRSLSIVANKVYVQTTSYAAEQVAQLEAVSLMAKVEGSEQELQAKNDSEGSTLAAQTLNTNPYPFLKVNDPGDNPVVAIIGQGVDYTHSKLGGNGEWADYIDAYQNLSNAWESFPNNVVIGGFDFASETGAQNGVDYNPLEYLADLDDRYNEDLSYEAGIGTMAASTILDYAPNAKILALKVSGINIYNQVVSETWGNLLAALEMAVDPNLDGDMEDAADVLLLDVPLGQWGGFYKEIDTSISHYSAEVIMLRSIASAGVLVVTPAGYRGDFQSYHSVASRSISPEGLSVGYTNFIDNRNVIDPYSPMGPSRGDSVLKPDIVASVDDITGAQVGGGRAFHTLDGSNYFAAARAAGAATSLMAKYPNLAIHEIKALLVNNANHDIEDDFGVVQIGGGKVNPLASSNSKALMYVKGSNQPSINFGQVEVYDNVSAFSRDIVIKNLTDTTQTYNFVSLINGPQEQYAAIDVSLQSEIILAPYEERTIPLTLKVNADLLPAMPMSKGEDFGILQWQKLGLNGYAMLEHASDKNASIHLPWLIMPRRGSAFSADMSKRSYQYVNKDQFYLDRNEPIPQLPHDVDWKKSGLYDLTVTQHSIELRNNTNIEQSLYVMPMIYHNETRDPARQTVAGHQIKSIAGGVFPEQQCESGRKLSLAVTMFEKFDMPISNHFDRFGTLLVNMKLYNYKTAELANFDTEELEALGNTRDIGYISNLTIQLNQQLQIKGHYLDFSLEYGVEGGRVFESELDTVVSPGGDSVIVNYCTDVFYHDEITEQTFDEEIALQFSTDRHAVPGFAQPVLMHNLSIGGRLINQHYESNDDVEVPDICPSNQVKDQEGNCIDVFESDVFALPVWQYFSDVDESQYSLLCSAVEQGYSRCSLDNVKFKNAIGFFSPNRSPGQLLCDFPAGLTTANCYPENVKDDNDDWIVEVDFTAVLNSPSDLLDIAKSTTMLTGIVAKVALPTDDDLTELDWTHQIKVPAHSNVTVSFIVDDKCIPGIGEYSQREECLAIGYLFDPTTGFKGLLRADAPIQTIEENQTFTVDESSLQGDVLGKVKLSSYNVIQRLRPEMHLLSDGGYAPFQLTKDGVLSVRDASQIDFEKQSQYRFGVQVVDGNTYGLVKYIVINVTNDNDMPPMQSSSFETLIFNVNQVITPVSLGLYFTDIDGSSLSYSSDNLPLGLTIDMVGNISGRPTVAGEFDVDILVSDGVSTYNSRLVVQVQSDEQPTSTSPTVKSTSNTSGGSLWYGILLIVPLLTRRFR